MAFSDDKDMDVLFEVAKITKKVRRGKEERKEKRERGKDGEEAGKERAGKGGN